MIYSDDLGTAYFKTQVQNLVVHPRVSVYVPLVVRLGF